MGVCFNQGVTYNGLLGIYTYNIYIYNNLGSSLNLPWCWFFPHCYFYFYWERDLTYRHLQSSNLNGSELQNWQRHLEAVKVRHVLAILLGHGQTPRAWGESGWILRLVFIIQKCVILHIRIQYIYIYICNLPFLATELKTENGRSKVKLNQTWSISGFIFQKVTESRQESPNPSIHPFPKHPHGSRPRNTWHQPGT